MSYIVQYSKAIIHFGSTRSSLAWWGAPIRTVAAFLNAEAASAPRRVRAPQRAAGRRTLARSCLARCHTRRAMPAAAVAHSSAPRPPLAAGPLGRLPWPRTGAQRHQGPPRPHPLRRPASAPTLRLHRDLTDWRVGASRGARGAGERAQRCHRARPLCAARLCTRTRKLPRSDDPARSLARPHARATRRRGRSCPAAGASSSSSSSSFPSSSSAVARAVAHPAAARALARPRAAPAPAPPAALAAPRTLLHPV